MILTHFRFLDFSARSPYSNCPTPYSGGSILEILQLLYIDDASETLITPILDVITPKQFTPIQYRPKKHVYNRPISFSINGQIIRQCYGLNFGSVTA